MDYFLSSSVEDPLTAQSYYSEKLVLLRNLGTSFVNNNLQYMLDATNITAVDEKGSGSEVRDVYSRLSSPAAVQCLLAHQASLRGELLASLSLPAQAHLYVIPHPLYKLHGRFDEVLTRILLRDKLSYILVVDVTSFRPTWQALFTNRIAGKFSTDLRGRLLYFTPLHHEEFLRVLSSAHVVLDPFPSGGGVLPTLQALSLGLPVLTLPSSRLGGRLTRAVYDILDYGKDQDHSYDQGPSHRLVASSPSEYASLALSIAHNTPLRVHHTTQILQRLHRLFDNRTLRRQAVQDWRQFLLSSIQKQRHKNVSHS